MPIAARIAAFAILVWTLTLAGTARGADSAAAKEARQHTEKGQAYFIQNKFSESMAEFEAAYAALPYSAFLYNAALAAERATDRQRAILHYKEFLRDEPASPEAAKIQATIVRLEKEISEPPPTGTEAGTPGVPNEQLLGQLTIRSVEPNAPFQLWERIDATAPAFFSGGTNPGWRVRIEHGKTPNAIPLMPGMYQVVFEKFQDFKPLDTHVNVTAGGFHEMTVALSQGEFMGSMHVSSNVEKASIYLDRRPPDAGAWGRVSEKDTGFISSGSHTVWVEAPGYVPFVEKFAIEHGETKTIVAQLVRVDLGVLIFEANADEVDVTIDDKPKGIIQAGDANFRVELPSGRHKVELEASGRKTFRDWIDVPRGQQIRVHATLVQKYPRAKAIVTGVAAVGSVSAGYFLSQKASEAPSEDKEKLYKNLSLGAYIAGGALGGLAIFFSLYDPYPDSAIKAEAPSEFEEPVTPPKKTAGMMRTELGLAPTPGGAWLSVRTAF